VRKFLDRQERHSFRPEVVEAVPFQPVRAANDAQQRLPERARPGLHRGHVAPAGACGQARVRVQKADHVMPPFLARQHCRTVEPDLHRRAGGFPGLARVPDPPPAAADKNPAFFD
jgi:hypothetical protein